MSSVKYYISQFFEQIAQKYSNNLAIWHNGESLTYQALNESSNRLAQFLKSLSLTANQPQNFSTHSIQASIRVGVYLPQGLTITQSILAIWKAGLVYVPLSSDADNSEERIYNIVTQGVKPQVILTSRCYSKKKLLAELRQSAICQIVYLEDIQEQLQQLSTQNLNHSFTDEQLAYIIYTSGTTGAPKGIMIPHAGILDCMLSVAEKLKISDSSHVAQLASIGFDASIMEIFLPLLQGAALYLVDRNEAGQLDINNLAKFYNHHKIDTAIFTASLLNILHPQEFTTLKNIISTGEKLYEKILNKWASFIIVHNGWGPSENTIGTTMGICCTNKPIHVGHTPIGDSEFFILEHEEDKKSSQCLPLKENEIGEIYIIGKGLGLGYWENEKLTHQRFCMIKHPKSGELVRAFRTHDLGLINVDNNLEIIGRIDRQIKKHGKLLCPEEIEATLAGYQSGKDIFAVYVDSIQPDEAHSPLFIAFLFLKNFNVLKQANKLPSIYEMQSYIEKKLTKAMIPAYWVFLSEDSYSLVLSNNKTNKYKIWELWFSHQTTYPLQRGQGYRDFVLSPDEEENKLIQIWCKVLDLPFGQQTENLPVLDSFSKPHNISDTLSSLPYTPKHDDNFFYLGGTSVQCASLIKQVGEIFSNYKLVISLKEFISNPTLGYLIRRLQWKKQQINQIPFLIDLKSSLPVQEKLSISEVPVFLIHSLVGNATLDYRELKEFCSSRPLIGINSPGMHGNNYLFGETFEEIAQDYLEAILSVYQGNEYVLAGWSGGGYIALALRDYLVKLGKKVAVILFDTNSPILFQKLSGESLNRFLYSLVIGKKGDNPEHSIRSRFPFITEENLVSCINELQVEWTHYRKIIHLFENLKSIVKTTDLNNLQKKESIGLLITVQNILLAALVYQPSLEVNNITLVTASETVERFKNPKLGWPSNWPLKIENVQGNHFFMLQQDKLCMLNFSNLLDEIVTNLQVSSDLMQQKTRASRVANKLNIRRLTEIDEDGLKYYIPTRGCYHYKYENSFDLMDNVKEFLEIENTKKVMLILAEAGHGKTTTCQYLAKMLHEKSLESKRIVLYIPLVNCKDPRNNLIETHLQSLGLSLSEIQDVKHTMEFIIFLDGYDEIDKGLYQNLYVLNKLDTWNAKIIITVRTSYIINVDNYKLKFYPFKHGNPTIQAFHEVILVPFNRDQMNQYVKCFLNNPPAEITISEEWNVVDKYMTAIDSLPGLFELVKSPFLLSVLMQVLPKIAENYEQLTLDEHKPLTQMKILDAFVEHYWERHEIKLILAGQSSSTGITRQCENLCISLASFMKQNNITRIVYRIGDQWEEYFGSNREKINVREGALLRRIADVPGGGRLIGFIHDLFIEYFDARGLRNTIDNMQYQQMDMQLMRNQPIIGFANSPSMTHSFPQRNNFNLLPRRSPGFFNDPQQISYFNTNIQPDGNRGTNKNYTPNLQVNVNLKLGKK